MTQSYDLTTQSGWKSAVAYLRDNPAFAGLGLVGWLAGTIIDSVSPGKGIERQSKAASDLIRAGKENGVKKMTITMDEQAGVHLGVPIEGVNISASIGSKGKTTIQVEYF